MASAALTRFITKFDATVGIHECWEWQASRGTDGYGAFWLGERQYSAHRIAYELFVGPIPDGLTIDHLCRNRGCVNPRHLEAVTNRENTLRGDTLPGRNHRKTHCIRGHEFTVANTFVTSSGSRSCRTCHRMRSLASYYRKRASVR